MLVLVLVLGRSGRQRQVFLLRRWAEELARG